MLTVACAPPFGVRRASPEAVHRSLTANVLSSGELSGFTEIELHRHNLTKAYRGDPAATLQRIHEVVHEGRLSDDGLFALAELSFRYAEHGGGKPYFLASAVYAYAYLFPDDAEHAPRSFDPRQRVAMDLYNRALTEAFASADDERVDIAGGTYPTPFGSMEIAFDNRQLLWGNRYLTYFYPAADFEVIGFANRYRHPGIGAPLAAATAPLDTRRPVGDFVGPNVRVPVTAFLRIANPRQQLRAATLSAVMELHPATGEESATIGDQVVPLEQEPTAALALALSAAQPWRQELDVFLGRVLQTDMRPNFGLREPHRRGRIPLVFVHGTASNFSVWANMVNDLDSDPAIRDHFEIWLFGYDSGQPILYSGMQLRRALREAVRTFAEDGPDPCLDEMVVIGHSQGGLLVKLTAIDSGDLFWRNASDQSFDEVELSQETRALLREAVFIEPLPFVKRAIFIATPQRGSYLAGPDIVRRLAQSLITMPASLARVSAEALASDSVRRHMRLQRMPTSIDNMSPRHPFIATIAKIPVAPQVTAHSIIGVTGNGPIAEGGDGVVKYESAHIDGVESELVVPYPHSMQAKPEVVAEVQRILHLHLQNSSCNAAAND